MRKSKRQEIALVLGASILLSGVICIYVAISGRWTLENVVTKIAQLVCGSFIMVIGTYIFAWGLSDEAGEAAGNFLRYIWDKFLKAFG